MVAEKETDREEETGRIRESRDRSNIGKRKRKR